MMKGFVTVCLSFTKKKVCALWSYLNKKTSPKKTLPKQKQTKNPPQKPATANQKTLKPNKKNSTNNETTQNHTHTKRETKRGSENRYKALRHLYH